MAFACRHRRQHYFGTTLPCARDCTATVLGDEFRLTVKHGSVVADILFLRAQHTWVPQPGVDDGRFPGLAAALKAKGLAGAVMPPAPAVPPPVAAAAPVPNAKGIGEAIRILLLALPSEARVEALAAAEFCHHCGVDERGSRPCQCWDDE